MDGVLKTPILLTYKNRIVTPKTETINGVSYTYNVVTEGSAVDMYLYMTQEVDISLPQSIYTQMSPGGTAGNTQNLGRLDITINLTVRLIDETDRNGNIFITKEARLQQLESVKSGKYPVVVTASSESGRNIDILSRYPNYYIGEVSVKFSSPKYMDVTVKLKENLKANLTQSNYNLVDNGYGAKVRDTILSRLGLV